jgi:hypothetical protein
MDAMARKIRRAIVSLTELKRLQITFDFFFVLDFVIAIYNSPQIFTESHGTFCDFSFKKGGSPIT